MSPDPDTGLGCYGAPRTLGGLRQLIVNCLPTTGFSSVSSGAIRYLRADICEQIVLSGLPPMSDFPRLSRPPVWVISFVLRRQVAAPSSCWRRGISHPTAEGSDCRAERQSWQMMLLTMAAPPFLWADKTMGGAFITRGIGLPDASIALTRKRLAAAWSRFAVRRNSIV